MPRRIEAKLQSLSQTPAAANRLHRPKRSLAAAEKLVASGDLGLTEITTQTDAAVTQGQSIAMPKRLEWSASNWCVLGFVRTVVACIALVVLAIAAVLAILNRRRRSVMQRKPSRRSKNEINR